MGNRFWDVQGRGVVGGRLTTRFVAALCATTAAATVVAGCGANDGAGPAEPYRPTASPTPDSTSVSAAAAASVAAAAAAAAEAAAAEAAAAAAAEAAAAMAPQIPQGITYWAYFFRGDTADVRTARFLATERVGSSLLTGEAGSTHGFYCFRGEINGQTAVGISSAISALSRESGEVTVEIGGTGDNLTYLGQEWVRAPVEYAEFPAGTLEACRREG